VGLLKDKGVNGLGEGQSVGWLETSFWV